MSSLDNINSFLANDPSMEMRTKKTLQKCFNELDFSVALPIAVEDGGTGADLSATGNASEVVMQESPGADFTVRQLAIADLSDGPDVVGNLYAGPTLVTLDHALGGTFTSGVGVPAVIFVTSDNAGTIASTSINATNGDLTAGWELIVTFIVASTVVTHGGNFTSTGALTLATSATAGQSFRYIWDDAASKYKRYA